MKRRTAVSILALCLWGFIGPSAVAQGRGASPPRNKQLHFNLLKINDSPYCYDKGRFQDNGSKVMEQIIAGGKESIPVLISMLTDEHQSKSYEIVCYWGSMSVGEIAYCALMDLFTDSNWTHFLIPGVSEDYFLGSEKGLASWDRLRVYVRKRGSRSLQRKWETLWRQYGDRIRWNEKERCFMVADSHS